MGELKISGIEIGDIELNIERKVEYLENKFGAEYLIARIKDSLPDVNEGNFRELYEEHPEALEEEIFPNQALEVTLTNTTPFSIEDFEEEEERIKKAIRGAIFGKLEITGIIDKFGFAERVSEDMVKYSIELIVTEDKKGENREKCKDGSGILFLKEFPAQTTHEKVISSQIPHQLLDIFHRTDDLYVITSLLDKPSIYLCFSDLGRNVEDYLRNDEYESLPQINFSDCVNELIEIVRNPLFMEICEIQYINKIYDWLEDIKKGKYETAPEGSVEHILRKIAHSLGVSGKGLQSFLDLLTTNDKNRRLFEETKCLIKAMARNPRAHGELKRLDDKYFTILAMKAFRDIYLDCHFFKSLNICFKEMGKKTGDSFEELWKEYFEGRMYLFSWNNIPGNDSERFVEFLEKNLKINWVCNATIEKIDDYKAIVVTDGKNSITLKLNMEEKKVTQEILGGKTHEYILKEEFGKLNIYKKGKRDGMFVSYMREEETITFQINFKDETFSYVVNLPENSVKEVVT